MGRRSDHSREELATLTVAAAREIILAEGVAQVSARAVAKRIGYSPGTLYNLFESLDEIIFRVNAQTLQGLAAAARKAITTTDDPQQRAVALGRVYVDYAEAHPQLWLAIFDFRPAAESRPPAAFEEAVAALFIAVSDCLAPFFDQKDERLRAASARVLWSGVHGITLLSLSGRLNQPDGMSAADMAELLITTFLRGLKA